jgi:hypothetical protein
LGWQQRLSHYQYKKLLEIAQEKLADGSLDSRMEYQNLIGAFLKITKIEKVIIDGKEFVCMTDRHCFIGQLSRQRKAFLMDVYYNRCE